MAYTVSKLSTAYLSWDKLQPYSINIMGIV